jgi:hypothetical protein
MKRKKTKEIKGRKRKSTTLLTIQCDITIYNSLSIEERDQEGESRKESKWKKKKQYLKETTINVNKLTS